MPQATARNLLMTQQDELFEGKKHYEQRALGDRLKELRTDRGLTLADLAELTGVSISFLSHVEKGKGDISVSRLRRILEVYRLDMVDLFPPRSSQPEVVRASELRVTPDIDGVHVYSLTAAPQRALQPVLVEWESGASMDYRPDDGEEFVYMLQGSLTIEMTSGETLVLKRGDSVYLIRNTARNYRNTGGTVARNLSVLVPAHQLVRS